MEEGSRPRVTTNPDRWPDYILFEHPPLTSGQSLPNRFFSVDVYQVAEVFPANTLYKPKSRAAP
jgi:hypothetical protein